MDGQGQLLRTPSGKPRVQNDATINTWVCIVNSFKESSLLGETDAVRLGIVTTDLKRDAEEVPEEFSKKSSLSHQEESKRQIEDTINIIKGKCKKAFLDVTRTFQGPPIKIQASKDAELKKMLNEDIIS